MLSIPGVTEQLARFVVESRCDALPSDVIHQAKRSLLNFFAVALAGCRVETIQAAFATIAAFSGGRQATLIGRRERIDALSAAFLNAAGANVLDFCDTHVPTAIHPSSTLVPPLLALSELQVVSGLDFLAAMALGQEVQCRIGLGMSPSHYNRGWHITATCGVFGAASGSGKLLRLDTRQMVWALGIAATQSSGLCECLGTPAKSLGVGNAARNGLLAALLAARNFAGPAEPLTGAQAYYNALGETPKLAELTEGLGQIWAIMATSYKPYPCGFVIHPVLDCVLDWRRDHPGSTVAKVTVIGNPLLGLRTDRPDVSTGAQSQVSVQHAVAAALLTGKAGVEQFGEACVNDPKIAALRGRIEVLRDESFATTAAAVEITTADGRLYKLSQSAARGSDLNPMSDRELEDKLRTASTGWDPRHDIDPLIEAIWGLHQSPDISKLTALAVPRP